jgi:hypothetical protein
MRHTWMLTLAALAALAALAPSPAAAERVAGPTTTRGRLLDDSKPAVHCGVLEVWTILHFDTSIDPNGPRGTKVDPKRIPVAVPCTELARPQYDKGAGNAGVLVKGKTYALQIGVPQASGQWGTRVAWPALKIDDVP